MQNSLQQVRRPLDLAKKRQAPQASHFIGMRIRSSGRLEITSPGNPPAWICISGLIQNSTNVIQSPSPGGTINILM